MTYEQFADLTIEKKAEVVWTQGRFLTEKKYSKQYVELYSISNFFVEIWFSLPHNLRDFNFLLFIRPFNKVSAIEPYIMDKDCFQVLKTI